MLWFFKSFHAYFSESEKAMNTLEVRNLYDKNTYQSVLDRINQLDTNSAPEWGTMSAAQMMNHCAEIQGVTNGNELKNTPLMVKLFKGAIRKMVVNEKPYKTNTATHPQYRQKSPKEFETSKHLLLAELEKFVNQTPSEAAARKHPLSGQMDRDESGWAMYKHIDHHLKQF